MGDGGGEGRRKLAASPAVATQTSCWGRGRWHGGQGQVRPLDRGFSRCSCKESPRALVKTQSLTQDIQGEAWDADTVSPQTSLEQGPYGAELQHLQQVWGQGPPRSSAPCCPSLWPGWVMSAACRRQKSCWRAELGGREEGVSGDSRGGRKQVL